MVLCLMDGEVLLCKNPYILSGAPFGCGQCLPCCLNRRRLWTHRLMLESFFHNETSFVTLTYSDECLPEGGTLAPGDVQLWLKRLRKALYPKKLRFFLVGEYGDDKNRPHYHVALYGHGGCLWHSSSEKLGRRKCLCSNCSIIRSTWSKDGKSLGFTDCAHLTRESAQYLCGYVTKKLTKKGDVKLGGRFPEFARMSNRPGIGAAAIKDLADFVLSDTGASDLILTGDVPTQLRHGGKKMPLGRYLRRKLREYLGFKEIGGQKEVLQKNSAEMHELLRDVLGIEKYSSCAEVRSAQIKAALDKVNFGKIRKLETKHKIYSVKGDL